MTATLLYIYIIFVLFFWNYDKALWWSKMWSNHTSKFIDFLWQPSCWAPAVQQIQEKVMDDLRLVCTYVTLRLCWLQMTEGCIWVSQVRTDRFSLLNNITMHLKLKGHTLYKVPCTLTNPCRTGPALRWRSQRIVWAQIRGCRPRQWVLAQLCDVHTIRVMLLKRRSSFTSRLCDSEPQAADSSDSERCSSSSSSLQELCRVERTGGWLWVDKYSHFHNIAFSRAPLVQLKTRPDFGFTEV